MPLLRRLKPRSLSTLLSLYAGGSLLVLAVVLGGVGLFALHSVWQDSLEKRAQAMARELAAVTLDAMLMQNYGTINRYLEDIVDGEKLVYARVLDEEGAVLDKEGSDPGPRSFVADHPVQSMGRTVGQVRVAIQGPRMIEALAEPVALILATLVAAMTASFWVFRCFFQRRVVAPLRSLAGGVSPLQPAPDELATADLPTEIEELGHSFQGLRDQIDDHIRSLEEANHQIRQVTDRACSEHRLAALGQLSAGLAHGLNTPIANVMGYAQLGQRITDPDSEAGEAFRIIERQGRSCSRTVANLLDMANQAEPRPEPTTLDKVLPAFARMLRPAQEPEGLTDIETDVAEEMVAWVDPGTLEHVVFNLVTNAVQAGATRIRITAFPKGEQAVIDITDNGPGIPDDLQEEENLFDPFVTTKGRGHGTGLGLYMCRNLMHAMGGTIRLAGSSGEGSRFRLTLRRCCATLAHFPEGRETIHVPAADRGR